MARSGSGTVAELDALVREHRAEVLALCLAHTGNLHDAEDRVQDVFVKAFDKLDTLRDGSKARAWLAQIARRVCIDRVRRGRRVEPLPDGQARAAPQRDERADQLLAALAQLPADDREVLTLYYLDGHACASVARSLGTSEAAVRQRLVRARLRLHRVLVEDQP